MTGNKSNKGIVALKQIVAQSADLDIVRAIVEKTIRTIYPLYYPGDVVQFFIDHHAPNRILSDINRGWVHLFKADSITIGTGTIHENEITRVFVIPEYQGNGYGSAIMTQLESLISRTYPVIKLDSSLPAFGMYLKREYKPCAWQKIITAGGQVLCYYEMEKEKAPASGNSSPDISGVEE